MSYQDGKTDWLVSSAPYLVDLLTFALFFAICFSVRKIPYWLWLNLVIVGIISPPLNPFYNYCWGVVKGAHDVGRLLHLLPPLAVRFYFIATILLDLVGLFVVFKYSRMAKNDVSKRSPR